MVPRALCFPSSLPGLFYTDCQVPDHHLGRLHTEKQGKKSRPSLDCRSRRSSFSPAPPLPALPPPSQRLLLPRPAAASYSLAARSQATATHTPGATAGHAPSRRESAPPPRPHTRGRTRRPRRGAGCGGAAARGPCRCGRGGAEDAAEPHRVVRRGCLAVVVEEHIAVDGALLLRAVATRAAGRRRLRGQGAHARGPLLQPLLAVRPAVQLGVAVQPYVQPVRSGGHLQLRELAWAEGRAMKRAGGGGTRMLNTCTHMHNNLRECAGASTGSHVPQHAQRPAVGWTGSGGPPMLARAPARHSLVLSHRQSGCRFMPQAVSSLSPSA